MPSFALYKMSVVLVNPRGAVIKLCRALADNTQ